MNTNRPKIKVPLEPIDIIADLISLSLLITLIIFTAVQIQDMPETIPTHFNFEGEADDFGSKYSMSILPGIGIIMFILFNVLNRYPYIHNYMVNITEENVLKNYRFSTRILRFVLLFVLLLFAYIQYTVVRYVENDGVAFSNWLVPIIFGISLMLPIFIIIYQYKMNKK